MRSLAVVLIALTLPSCAMLTQKIKEPKVSLESVDVRDADFTGGTLVFGIKVENPNDFELRVDSVAYDIELGEKPLTSENVTHPLKVAGGKSALFKLPARFKYTDLVATVAGLIGKGSTTYRLKGAAKLSVLSLPFDERGTLVFEGGKIKHEPKK